MPAPNSSASYLALPEIEPAKVAAGGGGGGGGSLVGWVQVSSATPACETARKAALTLIPLPALVTV